MARMTDKELIRLAMIYAEQDRESFLEAIAHCKDTEYRKLRSDTESLVRQFKAYRQKHYGESMRDRLDGAKMVTIAELRAAQENPA